MKNRSQSGFTIVELLIVVVVIAILAAITIVSYNGISNQAKASAAKSTAVSLQKKVELYHSIHSSYPADLVDMDDASQPYHLIGDGFEFNQTVDATNGEGKVLIRKCAPGATDQASITDSNITGLQVQYWDYQTNALSSPTLIGSGDCPNQLVGIL